MINPGLTSTNVENHRGIQQKKQNPALTHDGSGWCWQINANMTGVY